MRGDKRKEEENEVEKVLYSQRGKIMDREKYSQEENIEREEE